MLSTVNNYNFMSRPIPEPGTSRWGPTSHKVSTWNTNVTTIVFWCVTPCWQLEIYYPSGKSTGFIFRKECYVNADLSPLWMYLTINIRLCKSHETWRTLNCSRSKPIISVHFLTQVSVPDPPLYMSARTNTKRLHYQFLTNPSFDLSLKCPYAAGMF